MLSGLWPWAFMSFTNSEVRLQRKELQSGPSSSSATLPRSSKGRPLVCIPSWDSFPPWQGGAINYQCTKSLQTLSQARHSIPCFWMQSQPREVDAAQLRVFCMRPKSFWAPSSDATPLLRSAARARSSSASLAASATLCGTMPFSTKIPVSWIIN